MFFKSKPNKIFCIGRNKTGTTSIETALGQLGFRVAPQSPAELLTDDWAKRRFDRLIRFCKKYDAFQDVPFSLDYTYMALDQAFPGSRFLLTVRDNADVWYGSMIRFMQKHLGLDRVPTAQDLKQHDFRDDPARRGELWKRYKLVFGIREDQLFDPAIFKRHYESHNQAVRNYFRHRPGDLLEINLKAPDAMRRLCEFIGIPFVNQTMPHENVSAPDGVR